MDYFINENKMAGMKGASSPERPDGMFPESVDQEKNSHKTLEKGRALSK